MAELSKTAKQSMVRETKEVRVETPEESIRQLRLNLDAKLYVTPDRIRVLLTTYDALDAAFTAEHEQVLKLTGDNITLSVALHQAQAELKVMAEAAVGLVKAIIPEAVVPVDSIQMAELPAQEHDEHHMIDFGHDTIHSQAEGGS
jgi:hypothetical protein